MEELWSESIKVLCFLFHDVKVSLFCWNWPQVFDQKFPRGLYVRHIKKRFYFPSVYGKSVVWGHLAKIINRNRKGESKAEG